MDEPTSSAGARKELLRRRLTAARRARAAPDRTAAAERNGSHLAALLAGCPVVCGFLPLASEPLSTRLLDTLIAAGTTVLVPVVGADAPLDWCRYPGPTTGGAFGIAEPTGPALGATAVRTADVILLPALAVDPAGHRLGRGGGHYDRTLALLGSGRGQSLPPRPIAPTPMTPMPIARTPITSRRITPMLIAVLFDGEILDGGIPVEPHDEAVTAAVTPAAGIRYFRS